MAVCRAENKANKAKYNFKIPDLSCLNGQKGLKSPKKGLKESKISWKIKILGKHQKFRPKSNVLSKMKILLKNKN